jgi:hypothetical protein
LTAGSAADDAAPGGLRRLALLCSVTALGLRRALRAVTLEENGMALAAVGAAVMRLGFALAGPVVL